METSEIPNGNKKKQLFFANILLTRERRLTVRHFLAAYFFPTFSNTGIIYETHQQSGKQDSFKHLLKGLTNFDSYPDNSMSCTVLDTF